MIRFQQKSGKDIIDMNLSEQSVKVENPLRRAFFQNAWVVEDVEVACRRWAKELGVGPFFISEYRGVFDQVRYRGEPGELDMIVALAQNGPVQIELIQPLVARCAYRDSVPEGTAFHHMCVWSEDVGADIAYFDSLGYAAANTASVRGIEFAYFDTRPLLGCMLEVVTLNSGTQARFAEIAAAGSEWDGEEIFRR